MANLTHAKEWLQKAYHDLDSADILFVSGHYTDTIGYLYHQAIEKIFKSLIAYDNNPIIKTHNLIELNECFDDSFSLTDDDLVTLGIVTAYHTKQRYPSLDKRLPAKEEIKTVQDLTTYLFEHVLLKLQITKREIIDANY